MAGSNPPFMSGVPELLVLQLLEQRDMYGYELVRSIRQATGDSISLGEGVVYPVLHSLEKAGALKAQNKVVNGRARVYYSVKQKGRRRLASLLERWNRIKQGVDTAIESADSAPNLNRGAGHV